ncbi:MAG: FGGY-family carbohydrate kinase [Eubacteriales bacterium]|nr:FGGY-family carbohydrate kinase [Eubacteriales bacterium]
MDTVIVLDFGTSKVRACLANLEDGRIVKLSSKANSWFRPRSGWAEMDAESIWNLAQEVMEGLLRQLDGSETVYGIGFSFFGDSLILLDENYEVLYPMIMAFDTRAQEEAQYIREAAGSHIFREITGGECLSMLVPAKLLWIKNHCPQIYKNTRYVMNIQEFILNRMGLPVCTDYTLANRKMLLDIRQKEWSLLLLKLLCIDRETVGKRIEESTCRVGEIGHFGRVKLPWRLPVILGAHDSECGFLGMGLNPQGARVLGNVSGTYEIAGCFTDEYMDLPEQANVELGCGLMRDSMSLNGSSIAGSYINWFRELTGNQPPNFFAEAEKCVKYDGKGEIFFLADNDKAEFHIHGLSPVTKSIQLFQAVTEGITFRLKEIADGMEELNGYPFSGIFCGGGGTSSEKWLQFKADLFQSPVSLVQQEEVSCAGAAMITAVGVGYYSDFDAAIKKMVKIKKKLIPNEETSERYQEKFRIYQKIMKEQRRR